MVANAFAYANTGFSADSMPDLTDKVAIVTGGNTGIGYETVLALVKKDCRVFMASRSEARATQAIDKLKALVPQAKVEFLHLDLSSLKQVSAAATDVLAKGIPIDILINNAGIMACPFELTSDGIESQFGTNHLGHFLFTTRILPALQKSSGCRIVNVSSAAHDLVKSSDVNFDSLNDAKASNPGKRYGVSKLCNILFTKEFDRRYGSPTLISNSVHPGVVNSELTRGLKKLLYMDSFLFFLSPLLNVVTWAVALSTAKGALAQLYAATSPEIESKLVRGQYLIPFGKVEEPSDAAKDSELAKSLWEFSERVIAEHL